MYPLLVLSEEGMAEVEREARGRVGQQGIAEVWREGRVAIQRCDAFIFSFPLSFWVSVEGFNFPLCCLFSGGSVLSVGSVSSPALFLCLRGYGCKIHYPH
jgi:hypothetical protein